MHESVQRNSSQVCFACKGGVPAHAALETDTRTYAGALLEEETSKEKGPVSGELFDDEQARDQIT